MSVRLSLFLKGNLDVCDVLFGQRIAGKADWNGINEVLRAGNRAVTVRVRHEINIGFAAHAAARAAAPRELLDRAELFGPFTPTAQFSDAAFSSQHAALVLSLQADLFVPLVRHRTLDYLMHPYELSRWPAAHMDWVKSNFVPEPAPAAERSIEDLARVIHRYRRSSDAPILVFNVSSVVPGETIHIYHGAGDSTSQRIRRLNCALVDASAELGFSIIDVDRIVAEHGARRLKIDPIHFNAEGCRLVCEEVVRVLDDYGVLSEDEGA
ncbi:MAG TPA: SGNH/GDSL hydrolase family protein [Steroidobacteraceae bacterium]|jgi:hypothetical protein|nr:SGNH/GDSL hydrolase family protein [Steroidobacteraceae bacterium]